MRNECQNCNHLPICKDDLKNKLDESCPYYEPGNIFVCPILSQKSTKLVGCYTDRCRSWIDGKCIQIQWMKSQVEEWESTKLEMQHQQLHDRKIDCSKAYF